VMVDPEDTDLLTSSLPLKEQVKAQVSRSQGLFEVFIRFSKGMVNASLLEDYLILA